METYVDTFSKQKTNHNTLEIERFYTKVYPMVAKYVKNFGGACIDVEDIFQDGIVVLLETVTKNPDHVLKDANRFLYGICKNLWCMELRSRKKIALLELKPEIYRIQSSVDSSKHEDEEQDRLFKKHFSRLQKSTQQVWQLSFQGKSIREISGLTGYSENYVRKKKYTSKKHLITCIQNEQVRHVYGN